MYKLFSSFRSLIVINLNVGHARSIKVKKNIAASLLIKGGSISISLILVPLTINYINPSRYGIRLKLASIVAWFSFFDIGLTQGLPNNFAEAKSRADSLSHRLIYVLSLLHSKFKRYNDINNTILSD